MNTLTAWFYNDLQQVGVDFEDAAQVAVFDRNQTSSSQAAERSLIKYLGISTRHTIIDFGAGTGTFAIEAALAGAHVYAVDVSKAMLALAQKKADDANAVNIEFHHAGFLTYEHKAEPVDFVVTKAEKLGCGFASPNIFQDSCTSPSPRFLENGCIFTDGCHA